MVNLEANKKLGNNYASYQWGYKKVIHLISKTCRSWIDIKIQMFHAMINPKMNHTYTGILRWILEA